MDTAFRDFFIERWNAYFPGAELPVAFYYTDDIRDVEVEEGAEGHRCFVGQLASARKADGPLCVDIDSIGCPGAKRYLGFSRVLMPGFEQFLSCGIPGQMEGERLKKSPEIVAKMLENAPKFHAPGPYIIFKRWDLFDDGDPEPDVVLFFATPDVLAGLYALAHYDQTELEAVGAPYAAGCAALVEYPYLECERENPRAILGLFDVAARPWVSANTLSFAVPMAKFQRMVLDMDESFLGTRRWETVKDRIDKRPRDSS